MGVKLGNPWPSLSKPPEMKYVEAENGAGMAISNWMKTPHPIDRLSKFSSVNIRANTLEQRTQVKDMAWCSDKVGWLKVALVGSRILHNDYIEMLPYYEYSSFKISRSSLWMTYYILQACLSIVVSIHMKDNKCCCVTVSSKTSLSPQEFHVGHHEFTLSLVSKSSIQDY